MAQADKQNEANRHQWTTFPPLVVDGREISIRRNLQTGETVVSPQPTWNEIFSILDQTDVPEDFLSPEERNQQPPEERPLF